MKESFAKENWVNNKLGASPSDTSYHTTAKNVIKETDSRWDSSGRPATLSKDAS